MVSFLEVRRTMHLVALHLVLSVNFLKLLFLHKQETVIKKKL